MSYAAEKDGSVVWARNWQYGLTRPVLHVSPIVTTPDGADAAAVFYQGEESVEIELVALETGKVLHSVAMKQLAGEAVEISSAPLPQPKGDGLAIAALDEGCAVVVAQLDYEALGGGDLREAALDANRGGDAVECRYDRAMQAMADGRLSDGLSRIQVNSTASGDVRVTRRKRQITFQNYGSTWTEDRITFGDRGAENTAVATWLGGEIGAELTAPPDDVTVLSTGGQTWLAGAGGAVLADEPLVFNQVGTYTTELGRHRYNGSAQNGVHGEGNWLVFVRGAQVIASDGEGELPDELPIDPSAAMQVAEVGGRLVVVGRILTEDADGQAASAAGLLTVGRDGVGTALFATESLDMNGLDASAGAKLDAVGGIALDFGREPAEDSTLYASARFDAVDAEGALVHGVALGRLDAASLPGPGESVQIDLGLRAWPAVSDQPMGPLPAVWLHDGYTKGAEPASGPLAEVEGAEILRELTEDRGAVFVGALPKADDKGGDDCGFYTHEFFLEDFFGFDGYTTTPLVSSDDGECADLAAPELALDTQGNGVTSVLMSQGAGAGAADLWELVWDGSSLIRLPSVTVAAWDRLDGGDFDGDGLEEVLLHTSPEPGADGEIASAASGYMLRTGGRFYLLQPTTCDQERVIHACGDVTQPPGGDGVTGAAVAIEGSDLDMLVVVGTGGQRVTRKGNFNTLGVANGGVPVLISSWGAVLQ